MSDENGTNEGNQNQQTGFDGEKFSNFQKEIDRKLSNTNAQVEALLRSQQDLINTMSQKKQPKSSSDDQISELLYTDPAKAAELIEQRAAERVRNDINTQNQEAGKKQAKATQVLSQLSQKYPDLSNANSPLSQKAVEIFESFSEEDKANTAVAYRAAIMEAVSELGVNNKKSSKDEDMDYGDFIVGSSSKRRSEGKKPKLDGATIAFAEAMGLNVDDKEVLKRLAKRGNRDFSKYR